MNILLTIVMILSFAGGMYLAIPIFTNKKPPLSAANIHGAIGLVVLLLLGYRVFSINSIQLWIALGALIMASFGGLYLVNNHKKGEPGPRSAIVIHGVIAFAGIVLTIISIW